MIRNKNLVKLFIVFSLVLSFIMTKVVVETFAQSGEGADVCTWYSSNGFDTRQECENWLEMIRSDYTDEDSIWRTKAGQCLLQAGFNTSTSAIIAALENTAMSPLAAAFTYGANWLSCMF